MRFSVIDHPMTGVAVPVSALRSRSSCGVGEYPDLAALATWAAGVGIEVIQLLPVNDTGSNSSPYSALSAFALHPLYLRLEDVRGADRYAVEIAAWRRKAEARQRLDYPGTLAFKLSVLERIHRDRSAGIAADPGFTAWLADNPWVRPYAAFRSLERAHGGVAWETWGNDAADPVSAVRACWNDRPDECRFHAWVQREAAAQLAAASRALERSGVRLKGDLPILMSSQSADVWHERRFFDSGMRAGAPPDMYSAHGQMWGFPVYDWNAMAGDGYGWWKARLAQAARFFHAFRIDHVLGFFRIWQVPATEGNGLLGWFDPAEACTRADLAAAGFDDAAVRWLSVPHVRGADLRAKLGPDADRVAGRYLLRIGGEDLYNLGPGLDREDAIRALDEPNRIKEALYRWHADRALLAAGRDRFFPSWYYERSQAFIGLDDDRRRRLQDLFRERRTASERIWERRGRDLLAMVRDASDMLVCAEDLGDVPDCVPRVLADLGILGLRIERWAREWKRPGSPFIPPAEYPALTVCTPSVHDTSTLRGWWEEDRAEREAFYPLLELGGACPDRLTPEVHAAIVERCLGSRSRLCMFPLQELLDLDPDLWTPDPRGDRVNVPGTVADTNWTWRMPLTIESLTGRTGLADRLRAMVDGRRRRPGEVR
ncbi:MAG: 4-alpha-glucanotransferase [Spirochaetes bacterium]|nr:4-alpha-glucanotransferase [Spirochaetota bacterium]